MRRGISPAAVLQGVEQFRLLLQRSWREVARNKPAIAIKLVQQVGRGFRGPLPERLGLLLFPFVGGLRE